MRANLTFFFSKIAPIFSKTAPPKDQNGSVVFYLGPSPELKWPYTRRAESHLRGHRLIGAVLTPKKDLFCGQRFGPNFGVVSALLNLQCKDLFYMNNMKYVDRNVYFGGTWAPQRYGALQDGTVVWYKK